MRFLLSLMLITFTFNNALQARDPGTGSNTTPDGAVAPATPDAASDATSIMGGGTPGNDGEDTANLKDPSDEKLRKIRQLQEENLRKNKKQSEKN
jgi:hypothetical protein